MIRFNFDDMSFKFFRNVSLAKIETRLSLTLEYKRYSIMIITPPPPFTNDANFIQHNITLLIFNCMSLGIIQCYYNSYNFGFKP